MAKRVNGILTGIFFIMLGVLYFLRDYIPVSYGFLMAAILGIELIVSSIFSAGVVNLVLGGYISYWGILHLLPIDKMLMSAFFWAMFFIVPAFVLFVLFLRRKKRWQLTLMFLFAMLGIDVILNFLTGVDLIGCLLMCVGIALVLDYIFGFTYMYTDRLQLGIVFIAFGLIKMVDIKIYIGYVLPIIFIWIGLVVCLKALKGDKR